MSEEPRMPEGDFVELAQHLPAADEFVRRCYAEARRAREAEEKYRVLHDMDHKLADRARAEVEELMRVIAHLRARNGGAP